MKDLISIIVPVYNREKYIKRCLDSLIKQSYKHLEIICINDGSTDKSLDILNDYAKKDKRIKIINNPQNMGIAYSRNVGLDNATAEYIMWCDSDDWYEKNMCKKMLKTIKKYDVDLVECSAKMVFDDENLGVRKNWKNLKGWLERIPGEKDLKTNFNEVVLVGRFLWNKMFRKSVIKKYNLRFPMIQTHEDSIFVTLYLMVSNKIYYLGEKFYNYFIHTNSAIDKVYEETKGVTTFIDLKYLATKGNDLIRDLKITNIYSTYNEYLYHSIYLTLNEYIDLLEKIKSSGGAELRALRKKIDKLEDE